MKKQIVITILMLSSTAQAYDHEASERQRRHTYEMQAHQTQQDNRYQQQQMDQQYQQQAQRQAEQRLMEQMNRKPVMIYPNGR